MEFSILDLFWQAGYVVRCVILALLVASVWCWAIIFHKLISYSSTRRDTNRFENAFWSGNPVEDLYEKVKARPRGASQRIFCAAMDEWEKSHKSDGLLITGTKMRIDRVMDNAVSREVNRLTAGLDFLATVGATAPFVGLFGTVWGIMNVFREIGIQENTNLAAIAPGIGEALAATALGLLAAIPAVIFYNSLSARANRLATRFHDFSDEFSSIVSREIEQ